MNNPDLPPDSITTLDAAIRERIRIVPDLDSMAEDVRFEYDIEPIHAALTAVLDRHKPGMEVYGARTCRHCYEVMDADHETAAYPCPTVRAIAKELGVEA